jgi:hypothetical protein
MSADILKFVCFIFKRRGLMEGINPNSFALIITPIVPVKGIPSCSAIFRGL